MVKLIAVSDKTYERLLSLKLQHVKATGKRLTFDEVIQKMKG